MRRSLLILDDDHFRLEHCDTCPVPGYLILHTKGGCRSLADLDGPAAARLGVALARATRAIQAVVEPERVYCLLFAEVLHEVHFHLFPRSRWLLEAYWKDRGTGDEPVDGPGLFQWTRARLGLGVPSPAHGQDVGEVCGRIRSRLAAPEERPVMEEAVT
jgi:diadenosine tetraphosphate (Ap4A) HIT family hydrolase